MYYNDASNFYFAHTTMDISAFYGKRIRNVSSSEEELQDSDLSDEEFVIESAEGTDSDNCNSEDFDESDKENPPTVTVPATSNAANWKKVTAKHFTGIERLCVDFPTNDDGKTLPIDIYKLLITDELLDMITQATNSYAQNFIENH